MYIDIIPNRKSPPAVLLRESVRDGKKIHKRTITNLSAWPHEKVEALKRVLSGQGVATTSEPKCGLVMVL